MPLTDLACRGAECPTDRPARFTDSGGLYLEVYRPGPRSPKGSKQWRWKYRFAGKESRLALGQYPEVGLADARRAQADARALLANGVDPNEARRDQKRALLTSREKAFQPVAELWWAAWKADKTERHANYVLSRLKSDAFPEIGYKDVKALMAKDFAWMAKKTERRGVKELPRRVLQTCGQIMRWAVANGIAERNPVAEVKPGDFLEAREVKNFARVGFAELPDLFAKIEAYPGAVYTKLALRLMTLTFVRTSELIRAQWQEFDFEHAEWTIPSDRVGRKGAKGERHPYLVPLSPQAMRVLTLSPIQYRSEVETSGS